MCAKLLQLCPILCDPMDCSLPDSSVHGILQVRILEWVAMTSPGDLPDPGINPRSPALQEDSLPSEPSEKPKNTGMSSLSLLQGNFPTQELNRGLLHCRRILYQLSYQGSPTATKARRFAQLQTVHPRASPTQLPCQQFPASPPVSIYQHHIPFQRPSPLQLCLQQDSSG